MVKGMEALGSRDSLIRIQSIFLNTNNKFQCKNIVTVKIQTVHICTKNVMQKLYFKVTSTTGNGKCLII